MENETSPVDRQDKDVTTPREALVKDILANVKRGKDTHAGTFKRMRRDMDLVRDGADRGKWPASKYTANLVQRHVQQRVASLYAKNPRAVAKRKPMLAFTVWDEKAETIAMAQQQITELMAAGVHPDQLANTQPAAILQDYEQGMSKIETLDNVARTLELVYAHEMAEQTPRFKGQMKQLVRRTSVTGVGFMKLGFHRAMGKEPIVTSKIADIAERMGHIERLSSDVEDGIIDESKGEYEELRLALELLHNEEEVLVREGLVMDFPRTQSIIVDPDCSSLLGFIGARWVAQEFFMSKEEVQETYGVDMGNRFTSFNHNHSQTKSKGAWKDAKVKDSQLVCVYEYYDRKSGLMYTVAEGCNDFLEDPQAPRVAVEQFFPFYTLMFNELEHYDSVYPLSDVSMLRDMQDEHNRSREGLREHRRANRPGYVTPAGTFENDDTTALTNHAANGVIALQGLLPGQRLADMLQAKPVINIDPNMYQTNHLFQDMQLVVGAQEANFGGTSGDTATETTIAEGSRMTTMESAIDDLDDFFTGVSRDCGIILLSEMGVETVQAIAGPGAAWPELSREDIIQEVYLEVEAGSTGRPNKSLELSNLQMVLPFLLQIPGVSPRWVAELLINRMDDTIDLTTAIADGLPSIIAMNQSAQVGTGDAQTDPSQQGGQGQDNAPAADGTNAPPQAAFGDSQPASGPLSRTPGS